MGEALNLPLLRTGIDAMAPAMPMLCQRLAQEVATRALPNRRKRPRIVRQVEHRHGSLGQRRAITSCLYLPGHLPVIRKAEDRVVRGSTNRDLMQVREEMKKRRPNARHTAGVDMDPAVGDHTGKRVWIRPLPREGGYLPEGARPLRVR